MDQTPSNRPVRPENLAAALKRNMARRKEVARTEPGAKDDASGKAAHHPGEGGGA